MTIVYNSKLTLLIGDQISKNYPGLILKNVEIREGKDVVSALNHSLSVTLCFENLTLHNSFLLMSDLSTTLYPAFASGIDLDAISTGTNANYGSINMVGPYMNTIAYAGHHLGFTLKALFAALKISANPNDYINIRENKAITYADLKKSHLNDNDFDGKNLQLDIKIENITKQIEQDRKDALDHLKQEMKSFNDQFERENADRTKKYLKEGLEERITQLNIEAEERRKQFKGGCIVEQFYSETPKYTVKDMMRVSGVWCYSSDQKTFFNSLDAQPEEQVSESKGCISSELNTGRKI